ncbi:beta-N-acetylhexosaminidase [Desulfococcaceae bacterium OttesenSCG-928-F15]|nr:beta-N-acetylhexosaminidase [Desulfococcaceae bacterium OttesenSCG-928-F15]
MNTVENFSADELAGQRMMIGFEGTSCDSKIRERLKKNRPAGIIFFRNNIENPRQLGELLAEIREEARTAGLPGLIFAIDQEGGPVARLRAPHFREFPGIAELENETQATEHAAAMAEELKTLGIHMNMAPVLDICHDFEHSIMRSRAFPGDAFHVSQMGVAMISEYETRDIASVAKHFPGIGHTLLDSHHELPHFDKDYETLEKRELVPFRAAIQAGVPGIMLSHILYEKLDKNWPASLSTVIARDLLRKRLGFQGVSMTDDLDMKAIGESMAVAMERIVDAEIDLALICHESPAIDEAFFHLKKLAEDPVKRENFIRSASRILQLKERFSADFPAKVPAT